MQASQAASLFIPSGTPPSRLSRAWPIQTWQTYSKSSNNSISYMCTPAVAATRRSSAATAASWSEGSFGAMSVLKGLGIASAESAPAMSRAAGQRRSNAIAAA